MADELTGKRVAFLVANEGVEQAELTRPWQAVEAAGGEWVDEQVVVCTNGPNVLVSSRKPDDLDAFDAALVEQFSRAAMPA